MKTNFFKFSLLALAIFITSCSNDDDNNTDNTTPAVVTQKVSNLDATKTDGYTKFSFSENKVVTTDNWDIAFSTTTILVNGGTKVSEIEPGRTGTGAVSVFTGTFANATTIPQASTFIQDGPELYAILKGSGKGWYNYDMATHIVSPMAGKVFIVKTHDGKYAKFEILSYYKDAPAAPEATSASGFYTFNFAYQANSTTTF